MEEAGIKVDAHVTDRHGMVEKKSNSERIIRTRNTTLMCGVWQKCHRIYKDDTLNEKLECPVLGINIVILIEMLVCNHFDD